MFYGLSQDQWLTLILFSGTFIAFITGRWRYDVVALTSLLAFVLTGIIDAKQAFISFGHPAVISVAAVLVLSYAVGQTGITFYISRALTRFSHSPSLLILTLSGLVALFSGFMNDVGALALVMPVAIQMAQRHQIPISYILMPLAFASLLGGTMTLIGTPPNLIISNYRATQGLPAYSMFDFLPVGGVAVIVGVLYIAFIGWRLLPQRYNQDKAESFETDAYIIEANIPHNSKLIDQPLSHLQTLIDQDINIVALLRGSRRILSPDLNERLKPGDLLLVEGKADELNILNKRTGLTFHHSSHNFFKSSADYEMIEVVVNPGARIAERTLTESRLREHYNINILGIARHGEDIKQRFSRVTLRVGDILLMQIPKTNRAETLNTIGCLPLRERQISLQTSPNMWPTLMIFIGAIFLVATGLMAIHIAFPLAVILLILFKLISLENVYRSLEGPLIILLGCFITVGSALEFTGLTQIFANSLVHALEGAPGFIILGAILLLCMLITDVINNSATAVIMAPIAAGVAHSLQHSVDPYLMAVCIGCSCTFNTPIGHHSNTLVMGPGGYHFGDYWRMGLLLDLLLLITVVPALLFFWPL